MPQDTQTVASGTELDGTTGQGLLDFGLSATDDTQRAVILGTSISSVGTFTLARLVLSPSLAEATNGPFLELGRATSGSGISLVCCRCIVPRGWDLYAFTTEDVAAAKSFFVDWYRATVYPRAQM